MLYRSRIGRNCFEASLGSSTFILFSCHSSVNLLWREIVGETETWNPSAWKFCPISESVQNQSIKSTYPGAFRCAGENYSSCNEPPNKNLTKELVLCKKSSARGKFRYQKPRSEYVLHMKKIQTLATNIVEPTHRMSLHDSSNGPPQRELSIDTLLDYVHTKGENHPVKQNNPTVPKMLMPNKGLILEEDQTVC